MIRKFLYAAAVLPALAAGVAHAQSRGGVTIDLGTTGVGAHLVLPLAPSLNGRLGLNYFSYDFSAQPGQVRYELDGKLRTVDALLDWYPRPGSNFRLTGGLLYNGTRFDAVGEPAALASFSLNGTRYNAADVGILVGKVDFRKVAPYVGLGWGNALETARGWRFGADIGVFYQGSARVSLRSVNCTVLSALCQRLAEDVAAEERRLAGDVSDYKLFPVLRASLSYSF